tara:strand:- start:1785 stop:4097 length:2313 start_codon:yes stop_codon:yes gene_type:complete
MGQYQITGLLGEGGMSQVFRAFDVHLGREVALKVLHQSLSRDKALTAMFEREAKLTASILHPNVVKVYTVGNEVGYFFIAMELVDATSLEHMIASKGALPEQDVLRIAHDVTAGLKAAHQEGLIHRDIKPGNMLVTDEGPSKLVDFGLAVQQGGDDESEELWATPFYVPPEKLDGHLDTYLGDIYSLGATLYHALAGKPPFEANTSSMEELKEIKKSEVDLKAESPATSKSTIKLIQRMMAYDPVSRPQSYDLLLAEIIDIERRNFGFVRSARGPGGPNRSPWIKVGICSALLSVGVGIWVYNDGKRGALGERELNLNTGDNVISAGATSNAEMFLEGRELLLRGEFRRAEQTFDNLAGATSLSPSTRMWNYFFQGTLQLLLGNEKESRESFGQISSIKPDGDEGVKDVIRFLRKSSSPLKDSLPVLDAKSKFSTDSVEALGIYAAGLKNWQQGKFESGMELLEAFSECDPPDEFEWIGELKAGVDAYRADFAKWQRLPNPSRELGMVALKQQRELLSDQISKVQTKGALPRLIAQRVKRIDVIEAMVIQEKSSKVISVVTEVEKDPEIPPPTVAAEVMDPFSDSQLTPEEREEKQRLITLLGSLQSYGETLLFSEAMNKLQSEPLDSWNIQELRQDLVYGFGKADGFIGMLAGQFAVVDYSGVIRRRQGVPVEAAITSADASTFVVDLGFGPNDVPVTDFAPDWLIEVAEEVLPPPGPATMESWEQVLFFALATNQAEAVSRVSVPLLSASPEFKERWTRLMSLSSPGR